jgi:hypothetical protein
VVDKPVLGEPKTIFTCVTTIMKENPKQNIGQSECPFIEGPPVWYATIVPCRVTQVSRTKRQYLLRCILVKTKLPEKKKPISI